MMDARIVYLHTSQIHVINGRNPRLELHGIEDLVESILENGVVTPIKVELVPNQGKATQTYNLIDGHRRFAACDHIENVHNTHIQIPAIIVDCHDESDVLFQMLLSNDSEPFTPFEEALMFQRLKEEFGLTVAQIANRVGRSASHVSDKLALLRADASVQTAVKNGELSPSDANTIIRKSRGDKETQREVTQRVLEEGREAVIDKDLKKGRMPKPAWKLAEQTHDDVWQTMLEIGMEKAKPALEQDNPRNWLLEQAGDAANLIEFAFTLGKLHAFSELSNLSTKELWAKLEERLNC
jgi:ParB/RepB/Spo0J family partition protein